MRVLLALLVAAGPVLAQNLPQRLGDLDGDGQPSVLDLVRLINHINGTNQLSTALLPYGDIDEDGFIKRSDVDFVANAILGIVLLPNPFAPPTLNPPITATNGSTLLITGVSRPRRQIAVTGGRFTAFVVADSNGVFSVTVTLRPNQLNNLFVTASSSNFLSGIPQPLKIIQDSQPPNLFIDFPTNGQTLFTSNTVIAGRVGDVLSGFMGLDMLVHSSPSEGAPPSSLGGGRANVNVGLGNNGTFERSLVPLTEGTNLISVSATDAQGNTTVRQVTIHYSPIANSPRLELVSGDLQATNVHRRLAQPVVVRALQASGAPFANKLVTLEVTRSDGRLLPVDASAVANPSALTNDITRTVHGVMHLQLWTDANGEARAWWAMGGDAGQGNNRVCAMSAGISNAVYFCASARPAVASQINVGTGNNQKAETSAFVSEPLRAWVNDSCNGIPGMPVTFTVIQGAGKLFPSPGGEGQGEGGSNSITVTSSITGHAEALLQLGPNAGQNIIEANFPGNPGLPATFVAYGVARHLSRPTTLHGLVLDNASRPIGGASCELSAMGALIITATDAQGQFHFTDIPAGSAKLFVNGLTATNLNGQAVPAGSYPSLEYSLILIPNAENSLPTPVLLPRLNPNNARVYYGTNDLVLTCEGMAGLKMFVKAGSMRLRDGTLPTPQNPAIITLNQVHHDDVPMPMPDGASPPFAWTLQPGGATFDPPITIEYPNMSGLSAGTVAYFLSFNHDTGRFEIIASGHVLGDGTKIITDPGAGLSLAGWGCNCPPYSVTCDAEVCGESNAAARAADAGGPGADFIFRDIPIEPRRKTCAQVNGLRELGATEIVAMPTYRCDCDPNNGGQMTLARVGVKVNVTDKWYWFGVTDGEDLREEDTAYVIRHEETHVKNAKDFFDEMVAAAGGISNRSYPSPAQCDTAVQAYRSFYFSARERWRQKNIALDAAEIIQLSGIRDRYCSNPGPGLRAAASGSEPFDDGVREQLPEQWQISVAGQSLAPDTIISFLLRNISAPDISGPLGTGSAPDFVSDDFVRLTGVSTSNGVTRYVSSELFQVRQGQTYQIASLTFSDTPPVVPESLLLTVDQPTLTTIGETTQVHAWAILVNGMTNDVTPRSAFTTYRISNPTIANVDSNGLVTAMAPGTAFVTAVNEGATSVLQIDVVPGDPLTSVTGFVQNPDGTPASGLTVTIPGQAPLTVTGSDGRFVLTGVATTLGPITVLVQGTGMGVRRFASINQLLPVGGGYTDAGILVLRSAPLVTAAPVAAGAAHVVALKTDGTLWTWGDNANGQLGDGTFNDRTSPAQVGSDADWVAVAAGQRHTLALKQDGSLWAWGDNGPGQLGLPFTGGYDVPTRVGTNNDWIAIAAGDAHSLALKADGTLWLAGRNTRGQLGDGSGTSRREFAQLGTGTNWSKIAAGFEHTLALQSDGSLWAWGANFSAQIGDGSTGGIRPLPARIGVATDWITLAAGREHSLALKVDGSLWSWGSSFYGQAGDATGANRTSPTRLGAASDWTAIAAGFYHSIAVKTNGSIWTWGSNAYGELGEGTTSNGRTNLVAIGTNLTWQYVAGGNYFTIALTSDHQLRTWGANSQGQLGRGHTDLRPSAFQISTQTDWATVAAGRWSSVALKTNGTLWTCGYNYLAELGDGTKVGKPFIIQIGTESNWMRIATSESHTLALKRDGTLWAWGYNSDGQIGIGTASGDQLTPVRVGTASNWVDCAAGHSHSLGVRSDGSLWAWGYNNSGQVGDGTTLRRTAPLRIGTGNDWASVAAGTTFTLARKTNNTLWAWGNNARGQLGNGTNAFSIPADWSPTQVGTESDWMAMAGGDLFVLALKSDGSLWAWGGNTDGQLGNGDAIGNPQFRPIRVGADNDWAQIDTGDNHALALKTDGSLWVWGDNLAGQVGDGTQTDKRVPGRIGAVSWRRVSGGELHTLAVRSDGTLWGWGSNQNGQVGDPTDFNPAPVGLDSDWGDPGSQ